MPTTDLPIFYTGSHEAGVDMGVELKVVDLGKLFDEVESHLQLSHAAMEFN